MTSDEPTEEIRVALQHVQECEQAADPQAQLRLAEALDNYAEKLQSEGHALDAANAKARAKNVRREFYQNELAHDTTADWKIDLALQEGRKAGDDAERRIRKNAKRFAGEVHQRQEPIPEALISDNLVVSTKRSGFRKTHSNGILAAAFVLGALAALVATMMPSMIIPVSLPMVILAIIIAVWFFLSKRGN